MDGTLSAAIAEYINQRKQAKLEPLQKVLNKVLDSSDDPVAIAKAKAEYREQADPIETAYDPVVWLTDAAKRAKQISLATHAAKFTHSDAKASSILLNQYQLSDASYLITRHIPNPAIDAVGNAAALDVARLLKLEANGETLIDQLQAKRVDALAAFTSNDALLAEWLSGLSQALGDEKLSAHTLTKQLYFPIANGDEPYHLVCPLYSSALANELYAKIRASRFGDSKDIRDAHKKGQYDQRLDVRFPATAVQMFGGSKPQNISQLNSERHGQGFLLNCAPPSYQAQTKPPVTSLTLFNRQFSALTRPLVVEFKAFLTGLTDNDRNFKTRYTRDFHYVKPLIDTLLNLVAAIQAIPDSAGWSNSPECNMKRAHQLLLDIDNPDAAFQREREQGEWLAVVASDFAHWLLRSLENKDRYLLGDVEHSYFKKLCLQELRAFERSGEVPAEEQA
ncbi:type I-F CRISPR-associated protein Csy1 [Shewanella sp. A3A]|nr:type I-F CRISPR-associated protein Csy1 [Shewanella ferrihydritica]